MNEKKKKKKDGNGERIREEIFERKGSSTTWQNKVVALLSVLHILFSP